MIDLSALSSQTGLSEPALRVLHEALQRGNGTAAQFSHPELGGQGQWMRGGMLMVGDMFNSALAAKIKLALELLSAQPLTTAPMSTFSPMPQSNAAWWPSSLGTPTSSGSQNDIAYALFAGQGRLAVRVNGVVRVFDLTNVSVQGVSVQAGDVVVQTAEGPRPLESWPKVPQV